MEKFSPVILDKFSTFDNETGPNDNSSRPRTDYEGPGFRLSPRFTAAYGSGHRRPGLARICSAISDSEGLKKPDAARIKSQDRKNIEMLVVASYNRSDWTYGWISILEGFSIYVNSELEETLDNGMTLCKQAAQLAYISVFLSHLPRPSSMVVEVETYILAGNDSLMQIQIRQENRRLLGSPYSSCEDPAKTLLNHYGIYERQNCISG